MEFNHLPGENGELPVAALNFSSIKFNKELCIVAKIKSLIFLDNGLQN
jgi:hypothetical protein